MNKMAVLFDTYPTLIIVFAVVPDQLDVIQHFLYSPVFFSFKFFLDFEKIHRMFDNKKIIIKSHFFPIDWVQEFCCFRVIN